MTHVPPMRRPGWRGLLAGLMLVTFLVPGPVVQADSALNLELTELAKQINKYVKEQEKQDSVIVGQFTGPAKLRSSSGPGIAKLLSGELQKLGLKVTDNARLEIKGDYVAVVDKESDRQSAKLKARVVDDQGNVAVEFVRQIFGEGSLATLFGLNVDLPPGEGEEKRDQRIRESLNHPTTQRTGTRIAAGSDNKYAIEVLVKSPGSKEYVARAPEDKSGLAFVPIRRGEAYAIRLINDTEHQAAITLTVDGLNMFAFSDVKDKSGQPLYSYLAIAPRSGAVIKGWHRTNDYSEEFVVGEYAKSAAKELNSEAGVGTITVTFAAAWPKDAKPPADEPASRSGDATIRGPRFDQKFKEVELIYGVIRASVSVRYTQ